MIRTGLFLYDHLSRRSTLEGSHGIDLSVPPEDRGDIIRMAAAWLRWAKDHGYQ